MAVDKNLFVYDLALVAILKNEGPYLKEWLDYHILAGVDHFFIYDNESPDNQREVLQPYVDKGIVTYTFYPGKTRLIEAYMDAVNRYRFFCRYMTFIDGDEFIFPKSNRSITEVVDEIFAINPNVGGLEISWQIFGSNGQEKADFSRGVLERFTRRDKNDAESNSFTKTIVDPRKVMLLKGPHAATLFEGILPINETGAVQFKGGHISPPLTEKIVVNHYYTKSWEEYQIKKSRESAYFLTNEQAGYNDESFRKHDCNEVFDDGILKYRTARQLVMGGGSESKPIDYMRLANALIQNLFPATLTTPPPDFLNGKMETFLTCRKLAAYLRDKILNRDFGNALEEAALRAVQKTLLTPLTFADVRLLLSEMPEILALDYPAVQEIRKACIQLLPQIMIQFRLQNAWQLFKEFEYMFNMLKAFDNYEHD